MNHGALGRFTADSPAVQGKALGNEPARPQAGDSQWYLCVAGFALFLHRARTQSQIAGAYSDQQNKRDILLVHLASSDLTGVLQNVLVKNLGWCI